ncbi:hypothetical protein BANRA_02663 [Escherichia coli]|nr:hypothetical protein BANRA_02663 [Escherichia coli]
MKNTLLPSLHSFLLAAVWYPPLPQKKSQKQLMSVMEIRQWRWSISTPLLGTHMQ